MPIVLRYRVHMFEKLTRPRDHTSKGRTPIAWWMNLNFEICNLQSTLQLEPKPPHHLQNAAMLVAPARHLTKSEYI